MATGRLPDPNTAPVTTKGDLYTYSTVPAKLAVGNNGETLVADSSTSTGLRWQGAEAAGKNAAINGGMDFWQRGTTSTSQGYVVADRWYCSGATTTWSQETSDLPTGFRYALKLAATGTTQPVLLYALETQDVLRFADKSVTLSYYVKSSNSTDALVRLDTSTSVDNSVTGSWTTISSNAKATTTSWTRVSHTFSVGSSVKSLRIVIGSNVNLTTGQSILITGVQLELGSVATPFTKSGGTLAGELAACQRYYYRTTSNTTSSTDTLSSIGFAYSTTNATVQFQLPVTMRVKPTAVDYANIQTLTAAGGQSTISSLTLNNGNNQIIETISVSTGLTSGNVLTIRSNALGSGYVGFSAEL